MLARSFDADAVWQSNRGDSAEEPERPPASKKAPRAADRKKAARSETGEGQTASGTMPPFVEPALCELVDRPAPGPDWIHEVKFDGYRMQLRVEHGSSVLRSRKGLDWTHSFPEIADAGEPLPDCIIDGEIVALDAQGAPSLRPCRRLFRTRRRISSCSSCSICCSPKARIFALWPCWTGKAGCEAIINRASPRSPAGPICRAF